VGELCGQDLSFTADTVDEAQDQASSLLLPKLVNVNLKSIKSEGIDVDWETVMKKIEKV
jgi:hypothetical protein